MLSNGRRVIRLTNIIGDTRHTLGTLALNHLACLVRDATPANLN